MATSAIHPITLWGHWGAPNPWKIIIILKELNLPYTLHKVELTDTKNPPLTDINPNGRLPAIKDPNTGVRLWESGAIILYLCTTYDKVFNISYDTGVERFECQQWLFFQVSGQGPYLGQWAWFLRFHPEKLPSAIDRYANETERVISVLDGVIARSESGWLVGGRCTYADLSFVTWAHVADGMFQQTGTADLLTRYPNYGRWLAAMGERSSVKECLSAIQEGRAEHNLPP